jgi:hypothetical protein
VSEQLANPGRTEQAISAVAAAYAALQIENGYRHDVQRVYRHLMEVDTLGSRDCPAVFVVRPDGGSSTDQWDDERAYSEVLPLDVFGYLKAQGTNAEDEALATKGEALLSDITKLQMADPSFGSAVIKNSKIVRRSNDAAFETTGALVGMALELIIQFDGINP